jgi:hypothetical protein
MDDPSEDKNGVCYFTENHQALFASCEYIAGQLYPDETFANNNGFYRLMFRPAM